MITSISRFAVPRAISLNQACRWFQSTAAHDRDVPGLIHEAYWRSQQDDGVGGFYLWKSRAEAEA